MNRDSKITSRESRVEGIAKAMMDGIAKEGLESLERERARYKKEGKVWHKTFEEDPQEKLF